MSRDPDARTELDLIPDWLTADWLSAVLGARVESLASRRIGDGLVGMNLRLGIAYAGQSEGPASVVVKLPSPDPTSRATGVATRSYEREVCFYQDLAATVDIQVATCHHAEWDESTGDFVLVLEDLSPGAPGDQVAGCTSAQARTAVLELARLHGPRWDDPTLFDIEWLGRRASADDSAMLAAMWSMLAPGFLATYAKYLSPDALELVGAFGARLIDWVDGRQEPFTITHGDYRLDNLMFATAGGGYPVAAVDWQSPGHGPGVADVSYFMGAGLVPPERRQVERQLVDDYGAALGEYGVSVDSALLWDGYRRETFGGVIMSVLASQIVGSSDRSEALFAAMSTRHTQHALDLGAYALI